MRFCKIDARAVASVLPSLRLTSCLFSTATRVDLCKSACCGQRARYHRGASLAHSPERGLSLFAANAVAACLPPLAPLKEATLVVNLSTLLRKKASKQRRQKRHQRTQSSLAAVAAPHLVAGGSRISVLPSQASLADFFKESVALPSGLLCAHALAPHLMGLYLCSRYDLLKLPDLRLSVAETGEKVSCRTPTLAEWLAEHSQTANSMPCRGVTETFHALWVDAGLAKAAAMCSERVADDGYLVEWLVQTTKHGSAPNTDELATLFDDVCVPFLCAFWGLPASPVLSALRGRHACEDVLPAADDLLYRQHDTIERLSQPLPWAVVESYLQLGRLNAAADEARTALHVMFTEQTPSWFVQAEEKGDVQLAPRLVSHLTQVYNEGRQVHFPGSGKAPSSARTGAEMSAMLTGAGQCLPPPSPIRANATPSAQSSSSPPPAPTLVFAGPQKEQLAFDELLQGAQELKRVELIFHMAQAAMKAIFHALLPALGGRGSGRILDALEDRTRWSTRYARVLGSLKSFLEAFEDVFFTLRRSEVSSHSSSAVAQLPETCTTSNVVYVSIYTGPVGPWLLYGRVIARFFPQEMEVPLGVMAEAFAWGLHFTPQFGDLPSLLSVVGRETRRGVVLPLSMESSASEKTQSEVWAMDEGEDLLVQWLWAVNAWLVAHVDCAGASEVTLAMEQVRELLASPGTTEKESHLFVQRAARAFPLLFSIVEETREAPAALVVKLRVTPAALQLVNSLVDGYICPVLRSAAPHSVSALARDTRLHIGACCVHQHPLLRQFRTLRGSEERGGIVRLNLTELLWLYTAPRDEPAGVAFVWSEGSADRLLRNGPNLSLLLMRRRGGLVAAWAMPSRGYKSPQDHLLSLNGLVPSMCSQREMEDAQLPAVREQPPLALRPTAKPVSLFELVAESEELAAIAAASAGEKAMPEWSGAALEVGDASVDVVWVPHCGSEAEDVIVWSHAA